ncbi:unnamed protein product [Rangifer tarandus platyrhynchus]|uniref:Uncharacterized protein n=1 Tax=Rangifer tarandus platyrhynchus TaxID=3082113 RepID=A0AC60A0E2_RANTA
MSTCKCSEPSLERETKASAHCGLGLPVRQRAGAPRPASGSLGIPGKSWSTNGVCERDAASHQVLLPLSLPLALSSSPSRPLGAFSRGISSLFFSTAWLLRLRQVKFPQHGELWSLPGGRPWERLAL